MDRRTDGGPSCIGLITARGGSKGLPRKNVLPLAGKPVIAWTIETALASKLLDQVVVSTEDDEIAWVARNFGIETIIRRPRELAGDTTPHLDVVLHALDWFSANKFTPPDYLMTLQPTSPLRQEEDIDGAIGMALEKAADAVVTVSATHDHPFLVRKMTSEGVLQDFIPTAIPYLRRQDLPPAYAINGAGFVNRCDSLRAQRTFYPVNTLGYIMPAERSLQIDTKWDLRLAEMILRDRGQSE